MFDSFKDSEAIINRMVFQIDILSQYSVNSKYESLWNTTTDVILNKLGINETVTNKNEFLNLFKNEKYFNKFEEIFCVVSKNFIKFHEHHNELKQKVEKLKSENSGVDDDERNALILYSFITYRFKTNPNKYIEEINDILDGNGISKQLEKNSLQFVDKFDQYVRDEILNPVLEILSNNGFNSSLEYFKEATSHHNKKDFSKVPLECCKSFEATMKQIIRQNQWGFSDKDQVSDLIEKCKKGGLIPNYLQSNFNALKSIFQSVGTNRNNNGSHGTLVSNPVEAHFSRYCISLTASTIIYMVECHLVTNGNQ